MQKKAVFMLVLLTLLVLSSVYVIKGDLMHAQVTVEEEKFHALQTEYWNISKSERDAAPTGSELNQNLVEIKNYPSELLRLKLVGVGKILTGIFLSLVAILMALVMMPIRLAHMINTKKKK